MSVLKRYVSCSRFVVEFILNGMFQRLDFASQAERSAYIDNVRNSLKE
jgi:hypothetical protein